MQYFPAPAKLNLFLHVLGRRADGYHELQTVFRFIDRADRIGVALRSDGQIRRLNDVAGVPAETDLVVRAARALQVRTGTTLGADLQVEKHLPMGGGLGGGSSDAATTLMALNHLWNTGLSRVELQTLGLALGADVPAFVFGRNAFAGGVGERLEAVTLPAAWYAVVVPPVAVSTASVFAHPDLTRCAAPITIADFSTGWGRNRRVESRAPTLVNDLAAVVCRLHPQVAQALEWLARFGDARMTG
ncbi:MAG: 4-(cytidine 5'-diphospho)-2-C-methyl-D-erythritol kinase, partial [Burkholderiales bacterium]|nr:4-(cytidine 5'-diphospho)-2-C-methyl-D-erythritol kinase [Burkholderiales bacterium]